MAEKIQNARASEPQLGGLLDDPTIDETVAQDPLFRFLTQWWRHLIVLALAIAAGVYGKQKFDETYALRMDEAGRTFRTVTGDFDALRDTERKLLNAREDLAKLGQTTPPKSAESNTLDQKKQKSKERDATNKDSSPALTPEKLAEQRASREKEIADLEKSISDTRTKMNNSLLALSDSGDPYTEVSQTYKFLEEINKAQALSPELEGSLDSWKALDPDKGSGRLFAELRALAGAKVLVDGNSTFVKGRSVLKSLAEAGHYVRVPAAYSLAHLSESLEEKKEALSVVEAVVADFPEQADMFKTEIGRLKG